MKHITSAVPIIRTKLHRPPVPGDYWHRAHLLDRLGACMSITVDTTGDKPPETILVGHMADQAKDYG